MKKQFIIPILITTALLFAACGEKKVNNTKELETYKTQMSGVFTSIEKIDEKIKNIDPEADASIDLLFTEFDKLEAEFKKLSEISVPKDFVSNEDLADGAYDYMVQANQYLHESFSDTSYNEYTLTAAMECYQRANKRLQYIISILHGEIPTGDDIVVE